MPPTKITYYFSINGSAVYLIDEPFEKASNNSKAEAENLNVLELGSKNTKNFDLNFFKNLKCYPRPDRPLFTYEDDPEQEPEWDFRKSVFYGYVPDSDALLAKCFEYDWSN